MGIGLDRPRRLAPILWVLLALFVLRVSGQAVVAFCNVAFLPPMKEWSSGLIPYGYLLPTQIAIIALMLKISADFNREAGYCVTPRRFFAVQWLYFGFFYLGVMVARYPITMVLHPESRWFGGTIPIFFHWVLATFVISVGLYHRRHWNP